MEASDITKYLNSVVDITAKVNSDILVTMTIDSIDYINNCIVCDLWEKYMLVGGKHKFHSKYQYNNVGKHPTVDIVDIASITLSNKGFSAIKYIIDTDLGI